MFERLSDVKLAFTTVPIYTIEPLNNGHVGDDCFVHYSEVVPSSEVLTVVGRGHAVCPL